MNSSIIDIITILFNIKNTCTFSTIEKLKIVLELINLIVPVS